MNNGLDSNMFAPLFRRIEEVDREVQRLAGIVQPKGALDAMRAAAEAFVSEAAQRPEGLSLDLADAFKGLVLEAAARRHAGFASGSLPPDAVPHAFRLLGKGTTVDSRNHRTAWAREAMRVEGLLDALATNGPPRLGAAETPEEANP